MDIIQYCLLGKIEEADGWYNRGVVLQDKEKHEEAIVCYDEAIQLDPENLAAYNGKGNSLRKLERDEEAILCFDTSIKLKKEK